MNAVITVVGTDKVGILAKISGVCAELEVNIEEVTQSILRDTFAMIMLVRLPENGLTVSALSEKLKKSGGELGVDVNVSRKETFDITHKI